MPSSISEEEWTVDVASHLSSELNWQPSDDDEPSKKKEKRSRKVVNVSGFANERCFRLFA